MRSLAVALLVAFVAPISAADKNENWVKKAAEEPIGTEGFVAFASGHGKSPEILVQIKDGRAAVVGVSGGRA